ncbi:MAG: hypothetical protein M1828_003902 [Chrysothrix sp. TS-e1954]|nr:MAG: hypothetical protein M1828_003902 [Chrysothrix sp. TS-e1954]
MDEFDEIERMAKHFTAENVISEEEISRWERLFKYSRADAISRLEDHYQDLGRPEASDYWNLVRSEPKYWDYSKEAFEHELTINIDSRRAADTSPNNEKQLSPTSIQDAASYLLLLEDVLEDVALIQDIAGLSETPEVSQATSDRGDATFCRISARTKTAVQDWLSRQPATSFRPTFVRLSKATKALDAMSLSPTLGLDATLPQNRCADATTTFKPCQDEYPVWYFFYGTLADEDFLEGLLSTPERPVLTPASISGGLVKVWGGKYKALVDGCAEDRVEGWTLLVTSKDEEESLMLYETEKYEVVRCRIEMEASTVCGLTFRFAGSL